jgi:2-haloacid dehalogenase
MTGEIIMPDDLFLSMRRRQLLAGLGAAAIGGVAAGVGGRAVAADAQENKGSAVVPSICVFDVNGTLLDVDDAGPLFQRLFGNWKVVREWYDQLILYSEAITLAGHYTDFFSLGAGVLEMLGATHNVSIGKADIDELRMRMATWRPFPDVSAGLKQLKNAGFRLVTLTNSPLDPKNNVLKNAGIDGWFEKSLSVDRVRRFKPAPQVYHLIAEELDVPLAAICMVAAHTFDSTIGAKSAGCSAALIARPGLAAPLPVHGLPQPDVVAPDLPGVATQMVKLWR